MEVSLAPSPLAHTAVSEVWDGDGDRPGGHGYSSNDGPEPHAQTGAGASGEQVCADRFMTEDGFEGGSVVYGQGVPLDATSDIAVATGGLASLISSSRVAARWTA